MDSQVTCSTLLDEKADENSKDFDNIEEMETHISTIICLGSVIEDIAHKYLKLDLSYDVEKNTVAIVEGYTRFFKSKELNTIPCATMIKSDIMRIPDIDGFNELIKRFTHIHACFCKLALIPRLKDLIEKQDKDTLQSLLADAPPLRDYDDKLFSVLHFYV